MRTQNKKIKYCLFFLFLIALLPKVYAGSDNPIVTVLDGSKNQIAKDSIAVSVDSLFFSGSFSGSLVKPYPVKNVITFHINEQSLVMLPDSFKAVVHLRVYFKDSGSNLDSLNDIRLAINYKASSFYTARTSFVFSGAYSVTVKVVSDTIPATVKNAMVIENEIIPSRVYTFSCSNSNGVTPSINYVSATSDELTVSWSNWMGADETDVEWAFIDSTALAAGLYTLNGSFDPALIFTNNATRITIAAYSYNIPLIFPGPGSVFVRARAVQIANGTRITAKWSSDFLPQGMLKYDFSGHEKNLNWQSSVSFAEEGKRKVVVQYYDGSLRSRQTVTKDNTSNTTITAETIYDYQGRPAIQVLPAPSLNSIIKYTANFNKVNGAEYDKSYFDSVISPNTVCSLVAPTMDNTSGAAWYYSSNNSMVNNGVNRYIPEANGNVFTQTEYTQDNTGRISRQSGVGQNFKLNSDHETKYYYSITPDQNELDALFGTEAGDHTHYFKNAVRDANGQYSVSYVDMHGRTVATALAGHTPTGMSALSSNIPAVLTQTLADAGTNVIDGLSMTSHKSLLVEMAGPQHFVYSLNPQSFQEKDCSNNNICYDCLYDLTITITDDCNNQKLGGHPLVISKPNVTIADAICNGSSITVDTTINLNEGEYQITKTLSISQAKQKEYFQNVFVPHNTCKSLDDFITIQKQLLPHSNCAITCASCRAGIGSFSNFAANYMINIYGDTTGKSLHEAEIESAYNSALASCDAYCNDSVYAGTDYIRQAMLFDVSPKSGQYANLDSSQDIYSIFYKQYGYSIPIFQQITNYKNEAGQLDSVFDNITGKKVPPQQLDATQFAEDFKPSWAEALLSYHPEYCKLQAYQNHYNAYTWDKRFGAVDSYSEAVTKGYNHPLASGTGQDPLATESVFSTNLSTGYNSYVTSTKNGNTKTLTMWQVAILNVKCPKGDTACIQDIVFNTQDYSLSCAGDSNQAWRSFQQLYAAYRNELLNNYYSGISCAVSSQQLLNDNHYLNFNTSTALINSNGLAFTSSGSQQQIRDSATAHMNAFYQSNCEAYKTLWTQQLLPGYTSSHVNQLLPMLVDVCVAGSDQDHPYGSRDISISSPSVSEIINGQQHYVRSFDDIIDSYNTAYSIAKSITRNADVITQPAPYAAGQVYTQTTITKPGTTQCEQITGYYNSYQSEGLNEETFSQYLKRTVNTDISDDDLNALLSSCAEENSNCSYLEHPVSLPPIFQENAQSPCTDCYAFNSLVSQYVAEYGDSSYPQITNQADTLQLRKNQLFTNFMNNQLGYSLTTTDYLDFLNKCQGYNASAQSFTAKTFAQSQNNSDCHFTAEQTAAVAYGYNIYTHHFDSIAPSYPYNLPADAVFGSSDNNSVWTNSQNAWSIVPGFTGKALQINSASNDTTTITLTSYLNDSSYNFYLSYCQFYNISSDSGYTNFRMYINGRLQAEGNLFLDHTTDGSSNLRPITQTMLHTDSLEKSKIVVTIKLYGGLHGQNATFKMDDFTIYGWVNNTAGFTGAFNEGDEKIHYPLYSCTLFESQIPNINYPFYDTLYDQNGGIIKNPKWTNSYNHWDTTYHSGSMFGIKSAIQDTATFTLEFDIKSGSLVRLQTFGFRSYAKNQDSGYTNWSMCVNGKFVGQDNIPSSRESGHYPVFNPIENLSGHIVINIKLFGGLHGTSSGFFINLFDLEGVVFEDLYNNSAVPKLCGKSQPAYPIAKIDAITGCTDSTFFAVSTGTELYKKYQDSLKNSFDSLYFSKCLQAYKYETFTVTDSVSEYHYTLYYYDQAGNLVQTIPPRATRPNWNSTYLAQVKTKRAAGDTLRPGHDLTLATNYRYNTLNQVIAQKTPDGGSSSFYYDRLGRLVLSQNAKQSPSSKYSYTTYDPLGRITEVGEITNAATMNSTVSKTPAQLLTWLNNATTTRTQITHTTYDTVYFGINGIVLNAKNLRNRVSYLQYFTTTSKQDSAKAQAGTFYSYDIEGNVDTLVQDYVISSLTTNPNRFFKKIVYQYDLISGKVNSVAYNPGQPDAFYHRYTYDAENRITNAETSIDSIYWENEAFYKYYYHGPLARAVIGELQVQGVDYAYTLQGWLKGINSTASGTAYDMGGDGYSAPFAANQYIGRDAFGFALHYFGNDYKQISNISSPFAKVDTSVLTNFKPLYNGNIAAMSQNQDAFGKPLLFSYAYDQLNRLVQMRTFKNGSGNFSLTNSWNPAAINDYNEDITYDANGNILKYKRYANSTNGTLTNAKVMDSLKYTYEPNSNRLDRITDSVGVAPFSIDIDNQANDNYGYDAIGNLMRDTKEGIDSIVWNVYGKIQRIKKHDSTAIDYLYDASGNRLSKIVTGPHTGNGETWYVRDAGGNIMSIYTVNDNTVNNGALTISEQNIYGSSRLGTYKSGLNLATYTKSMTYMNRLGSVGYYSNFTRGQKFFELTNHLGNVLVTVTDKKKATDGNNDGVINFYTADIVSASDYYPFGMQMPGRDTVIKGSCRYGFNGKEIDNETYGQGNEYDYGFRIYNPRVGRFLSVDPLTEEFPWYSPFQYAGNSPIANIDLDGGEPKPSISGVQEGQTQVTTGTVIQPSPAAHGSVAIEKSKQWFWHNGSKDYGTQAGWYSSEDYTKVLTSIGKDLAGYQGLYSSSASNTVTGQNWTKDEKLNVVNTKLGQFIGTGLSDAAVNHLMEAASNYSSQRNFAVSGFTEPSTINSEDILVVPAITRTAIKTISAAFIEASAKLVTRASIDAKLTKYLLNMDHPIGKTKAKWFAEALGITKDDADFLAKQLQFDISKAVFKGNNGFSDLFEQFHTIKGKNGRIIDVQFNWEIRNGENFPRLIGAIPTKQK